MAFVERFRQILASWLGSSEFVADESWLLGEVRCHCPNCTRKRLTWGHQLLAHTQVCVPLLTKLQIFRALMRPGPKLNLNNVATIGASAMQPSGGTDGVTRVSADSKEKLANLEDWWRRGEGGVSAYQVCHEEKIVSTQRYLGFMRKMSTH